MTTLPTDVSYIAIPLDHPADPRPGDLCRSGTVVGVMAYNRLYEDARRQLRDYPTLNLPTDPYTGQYEFGEGRKPVSFQPSAHRTRVRNQTNETAMPGSIVRYFDRPVGPVDEAANAAVSGPSASHDAVVGLLLEAIPPQTTAQAPVLMQYSPRDWHWLSCPAVERTPGRCGGAWVFRKTRIPVHHLFDHLSEGGSVDEFVSNLPGLRKEDVQAVLRHEAADLSKYADLPEGGAFPPATAAPKQ
jgi:uncharacterized protein (DUF433 family)